jgi:hypothetical protein
MSERADDAQLKALVASERGLDHRAAQFLRGSTLAEVEASADALVKLIGQGDKPEPAAATGAPDPFTGAAAAKAQRKRDLLNTVTGRTPQPRDERGRFSGFDGGAQQPVPPPPEDHGAWLARVIRERRADAGALF